MNYYKKVNLPNPIDLNKLNELIYLKLNKPAYFKRKYLYVSKETEYFLSNDIKNFFKNLKIFPDTLILFGHINDSSKNKIDAEFHTDIFLDNNQWTRNPFAINFELTKSQATIKWVDPDCVKEFYPEPKSLNIDYDFANGIHYKILTEIEINDRCTLDQTSPVLIRTDEPHSVCYEPGFESRLSLSLRFPMSQISSFSKATDFFG